MKHPPDEAELRSAFARANHSAELEGVQITDAMRAQQERVIRGEISVEDAVEENRKEASARPSV